MLSNGREALKAIWAIRGHFNSTCISTAVRSPMFSVSCLSASRHATSPVSADYRTNRPSPSFCVT